MSFQSLMGPAGNLQSRKDRLGCKGCGPHTWYITKKPPCSFLGYRVEPPVISSTTSTACTVAPFEGNSISAPVRAFNCVHLCLCDINGGREGEGEGEREREREEGSANA